MPTSSRHARSLRKGENANIPTPPPAACLEGDDRGDESSKADGDMSDEGKKPWETGASKGDDDEDDKDPSDTSKADDDEDEDDEDDDGDKASKSQRFRADLNKAIKFLARHGELHDPAVQKEALMVKELKGGGLNKSERQQLRALLGDGVEKGGLSGQVQAAQSPGPALRKSMVDNRAMAEAYDNVTKSLHAQASFIDSTAKSLEDTNYAMARLLSKAMGAIGHIYDRQEAMVEALGDLARQPVGGPRSQGLRWSEKSFGGDAGGQAFGGKGGKIAKASPQKVRETLKALAKSHGPRSQAGQAFQLAAEGMLLNKPLMPSVEAAVEEELQSAG